jgi:adenine-specific DNA-methyltransferase
MKSYKHKDKRAHIPSTEEAGYEQANPAVRAGRSVADFPLNPVVHRGQDPELFWMNKYGPEDQFSHLSVDIRSLYRHEHISPEMIMKGLYRNAQLEKGDQLDLFSVNELFGNALERDELDKVADYYRHSDGWSNRLIQGDSLLVMTSLLEREGLAGKVQTIYFDPPYGIKYGGNWQMKLNSRDVKDGADEAITGEPEQIKAYRDTWELGIHSYLSYLRDRLLVAKELLTESGSCFVQISDENVHLVRCLMDEVFGSENFCSQIIFEKTRGQTSFLISPVYDCILWYSKNKEIVKYRPLFFEKQFGGEGTTQYKYIESPDGKTERSLSREELASPENIPKDWKVFSASPLVSESGNASDAPRVEFNGKLFSINKGSWKTSLDGFEKLKTKKRLLAFGNTLMFKRYYNDFPFLSYSNIWSDVFMTGFSEKKVYVVQTSFKAIQRCLLMTTDPGDLVLDPTCGSGTTAYVAEQWGRRWITIDTSRIAMHVAKTRLLTANFPYYHLYSDVEVERQEKEGKIVKKIKASGGTGEPDIRQGFVYEEVPHITLKALANDEPFESETLYDKPYEDKSRMRVAGPFTVETLQSFEPIPPEALDDPAPGRDELESFEDRIFEHLKSAGVRNGVRDEHAVFTRVDRLSSGYLHAEGFYQSKTGERKAYFHIGPRFGAVSRQAVNEAVKECRQKGDADWLVILGFSFESTIETQEVTTSVGSFLVTKARMHDDLLQEGLLKKDKKAGSFVTIGEPDVAINKLEDGFVQVEIRGLDIYDPIQDQVKPRSVADIAYWIVDDDYDGSNFVVRQVFFCGGNHDEFDKWRKGLDAQARLSAKRKAEHTLRIEIDEEAFERLYGFVSHPIAVRKAGQRIAVRVVSQFGEESLGVVGV